MEIMSPSTRSFQYHHRYHNIIMHLIMHMIFENHKGGVAMHLFYASYAPNYYITQCNKAFYFSTVMHCRCLLCQHASYYMKVSKKAETQH